MVHKIHLKSYAFLNVQEQKEKLHCFSSKLGHFMHKKVISLYLDIFYLFHQWYQISIMITFIHWIVFHFIIFIHLKFICVISSTLVHPMHGIKFINIHQDLFHAWKFIQMVKCIHQNPFHSFIQIYFAHGHSITHFKVSIHQNSFFQLW